MLTRPVRNFELMTVPIHRGGTVARGSEHLFQAESIEPFWTILGSRRSASGQIRKTSGRAYRVTPETGPGSGHSRLPAAGQTRTSTKTKPRLTAGALSFIRALRDQAAIASAFRFRRHQPSRPPPTNIRPGRPAPMSGPVPRVSGWRRFSRPPGRQRASRGAKVSTLPDLPTYGPSSGQAPAGRFARHCPYLSDRSSAARSTIAPLVSIRKVRVLIGPTIGRGEGAASPGQHRGGPGRSRGRQNGRERKQDSEQREPHG
jgi:hypothetical protein